MNSRRCAGGLAPALTLALVASLLSGCLQVNEVGPDPLFDDLNSLLIEQDDGGYRAISLCSSDPFFTDGDVKALGFKASLRELGLSHGSTVALGQHVLPFAPQPLDWSEGNQAWSAGPELGAQAPRLQLPDLRTSMIECGGERSDAEVADGWLAGLTRVASTSDGAVVSRQVDGEHFWLTLAPDSKGQTILRSYRIHAKVVDVADSDAGKVWLLEDRLLLHGASGAVAVELPPDAGFDQGFVARDKSGDRIALLTERGIDWYLTRYQAESGGEMRFLDDQEIELPSSGSPPNRHSDLAFTPDGDLVGMINRTGAFDVAWGTGELEFATDPHWSEVLAFVQVRPGRLVSVARSGSGVVVRDSEEGRDTVCPAVAANEFLRSYSLLGRVLITSRQEVFDVFGGECVSHATPEFSVDRKLLGSQTGLVLGFAVVFGEECRTQQSRQLLSPARFGAAPDFCYNQQVTGDAFVF